MKSVDLNIAHLVDLVDMSERDERIRIQVRVWLVREEGTSFEGVGSFVYARPL